MAPISVSIALARHKVPLWGHRYRATRLVHLMVCLFKCILLQLSLIFILPASEGWPNYAHLQSSVNWQKWFGSASRRNKRPQQIVIQNRLAEPALYLSPEQTAKSKENTPHPLIGCQTSRVEKHATKLGYYDLYTTQKTCKITHYHCICHNC